MGFMRISNYKNTKRVILVEYSINEILYGWEDDIQIFFVWLEVICGLHREGSTYLELKESINTKDDLDIFVSIFDGDISRVENNISNFLLAKAS